MCVDVNVSHKNFKTMTAPENSSTQFASLAVDLSGDIVAAGALDKAPNKSYDIFLWSLKTGRLLHVSGLILKVFPSAFLFLFIWKIVVDNNELSS